jgi:hypothetical protein
MIFPASSGLNPARSMALEKVEPLDIGSDGWSAGGVSGLEIGDRERLMQAGQSGTAPGRSATPALA